MLIAVASFGIFRIRLGLLPRHVYAERQGRNTFYRMPQRSHLMVGAIFLLMAAWLLAMAFGWV